MKNIAKNKKGSVLVFALIVLSFILLASFSLASISLIERRSSDASVNSATAFQNSDKGMEEFLQQLYKDLDQNDTLDDMASSIDDIYGNNNEYVCSDGDAGTSGGATPITIGTVNTEFIISAYTEAVDSNTQDTGGWNKVEAITDCNTALADVARFKVIGNHNNAVRAVFLKLKDSLNRGLVAHWSFEDRAYVARVAPNSENRISYIAQDYSKQNHTLTLCQLRTESGETEVNVEVIDGSTTIDKKIVEFPDVCIASKDITKGMSPKRGYEDNGVGHGTNDDEYEDTGSWVEGIIKESILGGATSAQGDNSNSEALIFSGSDYLATYFANNCGADEINCVNDANDKLKVDDGISISLWVKKTTDGALVSRWFNDEGFKLSIESNKACLYLNDKVTCSETDIATDDWYHIVGEWRKKDGNIKMYVNGKDDSDTSAGSLNFVIKEVVDVPLSIGVEFDDNEASSNYFTGTLDDVKIWNRSLTQKEICRLCEVPVTDSGFKCDATACP